MFIKNNTIHFPDSPREQALLPWLEKHTVKLPGKYDPDVANVDINIDNRNIEALIAEGLVYVEANTSSNPVIRMFINQHQKCVKLNIAVIGMKMFQHQKPIQKLH